jgi:phosphoglycerate dehydrogenase-like enzyme
MSFKFVFLPPAGDRVREWAAKIRQAVPGLQVTVCASREEALSALSGARGAFGTMDPELLKAAPDLEWLACPAAGPSPSFYFRELIDSPVVVTNMRGIYNDHISAHIMAFVLAFSRGMHQYFRDQFEGVWQKGGESRPSVYLPESIALIVGVGGIGGATALHCKHFGMKVIGIDPRVSRPPEGVDELYPPEQLDQHLPRGDFVIITTPQTPHTQGLFNAGRLARMKKTAFLINIGRGTTVQLEALDQALRQGTIAGAGLDVFEQEPLPPGHPLWTAPNFLMTPHVAASGPYLEERRLNLVIENCRRLAEGKELVNVVDKANWF